MIVNNSCLIIEHLNSIFLLVINKSNQIREIEIK